jgi:hypothetical protein
MGRGQRANAGEPLPERGGVAEAKHLDGAPVPGLGGEQAEGARHLARIPAGGCEAAEPVGIRFALQPGAVALDRGQRREAQSATENGEGRPAQHRRTVPARSGGGSGTDARDVAGPVVGRRGAAALPRPPRRVMVHEVGELTREERGELGLVLEPAQQARVQVDAAARHGEHIECRVREHADSGHGRAGRRGLPAQEPLDDLAEIVLEQGIEKDPCALGEHRLLALGA